MSKTCKRIKPSNFDQDDAFLREILKAGILSERVYKKAENLPQEPPKDFAYFRDLKVDYLESLNYNSRYYNPKFTEAVQNAKQELPEGKKNGV